MSRWTVFVLALMSATASAAPPQAPRIALRDANPNSATHGLEIGVADFRGQFQLWYFRDAACTRCDEELRAVHRLWQELVDDGLEASLVAVVSEGDGETSTAPRSRSMSWLRDAERKARAAWGTQSGDLVVVGPDGRVRGKVALAEVDLADGSTADEIEQWVENAAFGETPASSPTMMTSFQ